MVKRCGRVNAPTALWEFGVMPSCGPGLARLDMSAINSNRNLRASGLVPSTC
jgi:hypothetical protein